MAVVVLTPAERAEVEADLASMLADRERLSFPSLRYWTGDIDSRLEQRAAVERGIARATKLLAEADA